MTSIRPRHNRNSNQRHRFQINRPARQLRTSFLRYNIRRTDNQVRRNKRSSKHNQRQMNRQRHRGHTRRAVSNKFLIRRRHGSRQRRGHKGRHMCNRRRHVRRSFTRFKVTRRTLRVTRSRRLTLSTRGINTQRKRRRHTGRQVCRRCRRRSNHKHGVRQ